jgi:predicted nucleic acid-binding protein
MNLTFVDTNILIYRFDGQSAHFNAANDLLHPLMHSQEIAISVQVMQEFAVNVPKKVARFDAKSLDTWLDIMSHWAVYVPVASDVIEAVKISRDNTISFWDAMIVRAAAAMGAETLLTEDLNDGQVIEGVRVVNPFLHS